MAGTPNSSASPGRSQRRQFLTDSLHIFVLCSFAFAQPLFDRLSHKTVFLHDNGVEPAAIGLLIVSICLLVPLLLVCIEWAASWLGRSVRGYVHVAFIFLLATAIVLPYLKRCAVLGGMSQLAVGVALGAAGAVAYRRWSPIRLFVTAASPAWFVFPAIFLFHSPVSRVVFHRPTPMIPNGAGNAVPIVLVVFDEFCGTSLMNEQHLIDAVRYPNFAALADSGTWFRNATSVHPRTDRAVPAILTGMRPRGLTPPTATEWPQNLFTLLLATKQYEPVVFEPYTRLFPDEADRDAVVRRTLREQLHALGTTLSLVYLHTILQTDLPVELPSIPRAWSAETRSRAARLDKTTGVFRHGWGIERDLQSRDFIEHITQSDRARLYFCHLVLPHFPWFYLPSGRKYVRDFGANVDLYGARGEYGETWDSDELAVAQAWQRYLLQVGYADHVLGRLVERLKTVGLFDRCLLVITADHGTSFRAGCDRRQPNTANLADIMSIPLFVKFPGQRGGAISDRNVESIDLLPTILDVVQFDRSPEVDGQSFADASRPERAEKLFDSDGNLIKMPGDFQRKYETLERMLAWFGSGGQSDRLFAFGPHHELVGRAIADLNVVGPAKLDMQLTQYAATYSDDARKLVPCYFEGKLLGSAAVKLPVELAITVNGTIQAVTRTYQLNGITRLWTTLVPETALTPGENDFQVYVVTAAEPEFQLNPTHLDRALVRARADELE